MPRKPPALPQVPVEYVCLNCDQTFIEEAKAKLFCSIACRDQGHFVRYARNSLRNKKINQELIFDAINIKLAHLLSDKGYYDADARRIPPEKRAAIFERDQGLCKVCGESGVQIDHINGDSDDPENLQLLCDRCHKGKTYRKMKRLVPGSPKHEKKIELSNKLWSRVKTEEPSRLCDDETNWRHVQQGLMNDRTHIMQKARLHDLIMKEAIKQGIKIEY